MAIDKVSSAVVHRLPRYYRHLQELASSGVVRISSKSLAQRMGLTASQIRQDLNCFGGFGQQGYGYNVESLKNEIGEILGFRNQYRAVMIGVGNIGHALISNFNFKLCGFSLDAAFDIDPSVTGTRVGDVPVYHMDELDQYLKTRHVDIGVLAIPKEAAPSIAERLTNGGVKGLWNFTNIDLHLDTDRVKVENVHFSDNLMVLCYRLTKEN